MKNRLLALSLLLAACGGDEPPPPAEAPPEGRAETRAIRNTEAVGYDGAAIADKVDAALDAGEARAQETEDATRE